MSVDVEHSKEVRAAIIVCLYEEQCGGLTLPPPRPNTNLLDSISDAPQLQTLARLYNYKEAPSSPLVLGRPAKPNWRVFYRGLRTYWEGEDWRQERIGKHAEAKGTLRHWIRTLPIGVRANVGEAVGINVVPPLDSAAIPAAPAARNHVSPPVASGSTSAPIKYSPAVATIQRISESAVGASVPGAAKGSHDLESTRVHTSSTLVESGRKESHRFSGSAGTVSKRTLADALDSNTVEVSGGELHTVHGSDLEKEAEIDSDTGVVRKPIRASRARIPDTGYRGTNVVHLKHSVSIAYNYLIQSPGPESQSRSTSHDELAADVIDVGNQSSDLSEQSESDTSDDDTPKLRDKILPIPRASDARSYTRAKSPSPPPLKKSSSPLKRAKREVDFHVAVPALRPSAVALGKRTERRPSSEDTSRAPKRTAVQKPTSSAASIQSSLASTSTPHDDDLSIAGQFRRSAPPLQTFTQASASASTPATTILAAMTTGMPNIFPIIANGLSGAKYGNKAASRFGNEESLKRLAPGLEAFLADWFNAEAELD
ncbi:hypothetical protein P7C70_g4961, partial [Phenoliferia sp. Uapishka_3]